MLAGYAFVGAVCLGWFVFVFTPKARRAAVAANPLLREETVLLMTAAGIVFETPQQRTEYRLTGFARIVETARLFLLYLDEKRAIIVPKRVLTDCNAMDEFRREVLEPIEANRT